MRPIYTQRASRQTGRGSRIRTLENARIKTWCLRPTWLIPYVKLKTGSPTWARTTDGMINSHVLYQLSYRGIDFEKHQQKRFSLLLKFLNYMVGVTRFELVASGLKVPCSCQLSYTPEVPFFPHVAKLFSFCDVFLLLKIGPPRHVDCAGRCSFVS